jgi:FAD/FMN-containing dehydrogenase
LQGRSGLLADNLISARVVLANGTAVTVSDDSHADLFWAIRGAGHNFGIVSELMYKIYDVPEENDWAYESFIFTHDKVEEVFAQINVLVNNGSQPVQLLHWAYFLWSPDVDPNNVSSLSPLIIIC